MTCTISTGAGFPPSTVAFENQWLKDEFPCGMAMDGLFSITMLVSGSVSNKRGCFFLVFAIPLQGTVIYHRFLATFENFTPFLCSQYTPLN